jgi:hypothetical protein
MRRVPSALLILSLAALAALACDDDPVETGETFDLVFTGDASFQGAHGGQDIEIAVVEAGGGTVVASDAGTVSATGASAFSFTFDEALEEGEAYEVHYWIDSNFGGGSAGTCDPAANDHQWSVDVASVTQDVTITDTHRPGETGDVCSTF